MINANQDAKLPVFVAHFSQADLEPLVALYHGYLLYFGHDKQTQPLRTFLEHVFSKDFTYCLVAKTGEQAIGFVAGTRSYSPVALGYALTINDLYVDDRWRRKKVGQALLHALEQFAHETGANTLFVNTDAAIPWLTPYYERNGFFAIDHRCLVKRLAKD